MGLSDELPPNDLPTPWRKRHVLAHGRIDLDGFLVDLTDPATRGALQLRHSRLLESHEMRFLDVSDITSKTRGVTQAIAEDLYSEGWPPGSAGQVAGILYESNLDSQHCFALFEDRYTIQPVEPPRSLADTFESLKAVCEEFSLALG